MHTIPSSSNGPLVNSIASRPISSTLSNHDGGQFTDHGVKYVPCFFKFFFLNKERIRM